MTTLAAIRPDEWNYALLTHVFGALLLVGAVMTAVCFLFAGWRSKTPADSLAFGRLAFKTLLFVALPAWFVMRLGAAWIYDKEGFTGDNEPAWLGIGWATAEPGGLLLLITIILAGSSARRLRTGGGTMATLGKVTTVLATLVLIAYIVAVWAMGAKPS
jgi:hypothetical protein